MITKNMTPKERKLRRRAALKRYSLTPKGKFHQHKQNARRRGVPFLLTFEEWVTVWFESGHFDERGNKTASGYVMARFGDEGPYALGNVEIVPHRVNVAERNILQALRAAERKRTLQWRPSYETDDWRHVHEGID